MASYMVIGGCSHTAGAEIDGTMDSEYNRSKSFANRFAEKLGYIPINLAIPGATNTHIARTVTSYFDEHKDLVNNKTNDFAVMVNWTECCRLEAPVPFEFDGDTNTSASWALIREKYVRVNPGYRGHSVRERPFTDLMQRFMVENETFCQIYSLNLVLQLQWFCKANNYRYFMSSAGYLHTPEYKEWTSRLIRQVDTKHFYEFRDNYNYAFYEKFKDKGMDSPLAQYGHYGEEAHRLHAEDLYNYFKKANV